MSKNRRLSILLLVALFLLNAFLVLSQLTPDIYHINPDDGAKYIESGHQLLTWGVRDLSWGPLVAFIYAPLDLLVGQSPNWFLLEAWGGSLILYALLWFGLVTLAHNLKEQISMPVMVGLLFGLTIFFPILENQSDALFLFFSMLALANLNTFREEGRLRSLGWASLMVGLGVLCRVETILLVIPLVVFALVFNRGSQKVWKVLLAVALPIAGVMALYAIISLLTFGRVDWGLGNKSFESFAMNQAFLPGSRLEQAYKAGEPIYGTVEEHQNSIFRILVHRPLVIAERVLANLLKTPASFTKFFGPIQGILVAVFSLLGIVTLIRKKEGPLLALLLIWPLHALVSLIFFPRHVVAQSSFIFIILAAIGITDLVFRAYPKKSLVILLALTGSVLAVSGITQAKALFAASLALLVIFLLKLAIDSERIKALNTPYLLFALLIGVLLALGPGFEFPARPLGQTGVEKAIYYLQAEYLPASRVLAPNAIVPIAARMNTVGVPASVDTAEGFVAYLRDKDVDVVYLDAHNPYWSAPVEQLVQQALDDLERVYHSPDGTVSLYAVNPPEGW